MRLAKPRVSTAGLGSAPSTDSAAASSVHCKVASRGLQVARVVGVCPKSRASANCSTPSASASSTSRSACNTGACPAWPLSMSRSSSHTSRWSRISNTRNSMLANCWRRGVRGDSNKMSRAVCNWSARAACCCNRAPINAPSLAPSTRLAGENWCAWVRMSWDRASKVSASICTR